jgi:hypothetical protein
LSGSGQINLDGNTFADIDFADAYFDLRPNATAWTELTDDDAKARLLLWAMRSLDGLGWIGGRLTQTQPLDWPRVAIRSAERSFPGAFGYHQGDNYHGGGLYDGKGFFWASTTIPTSVKNAQCEFALAAQQNAILSTPDKYKVRKITDKNGTLEYNTGKDANALTSFAMRELSGLLITSASQTLIARA